MSAYLTVEEAEEIIEEQILNTVEWDASSDDDKEKALTYATKLIDNLNFLGSKTDETQTLQFPRGGDTEIPDDIKEACVFIADRLLQGIDIEMEYETAFMTTSKYANVQANFNRSTIPEHIVVGIPSIRAWLKLKPYLQNNRVVILSRV